MSWKKLMKPKARTTTRTQEQVNQEYANLCVQAGDIHHKLARLPKQLEAIERRMVELDAEADAAKLVEQTKAQQAQKVAGAAKGEPSAEATN